MPQQKSPAASGAHGGAAFDYESKVWGSAPVSPKPWHLQGLKLLYCLEDLAPVRGRVLDAGCGGGNMARAIKQARPDLDVKGVDLSRAGVENARRHAGGVDFEVGDVERLRYPDRSFDAVVMFDVLEHLERPQRALSEVARVLKPGGVFHVAQPLEHEPGTLHRLLRRRGWTAKVRHSGHVQAFDTPAFQGMLAAAGLHVRRVRYSAHHLMTLADVAYYAWLDLRGGSGRSLDDRAADPGAGSGLLRAMRSAVAVAGWYESKLLAGVPGTCGHFGCRL